MALNAADLLKYAASMEGVIVLCKQRNGVKRFGKYNIMCCIRCFVALAMSVFGVQEPVYDQVLHSWFSKRQSKKVSQSESGIWKQFGAVGIVGMRWLVSKVSGAVETGTVNVFTVFILLCETRQCLNRYGRNGVTYLCERVSNSKSLRETVAEAAAQVFQQDKSALPHSVVVLEAVRSSIGLSLAQLRRQRPQRQCSLAAVCVKMAVLGICGKATLEGIPEWVVLEKAFNVLVYKICAASAEISWERVAACARVVSVSLWGSAGRRKSKRILRQQVNCALRNVSGVNLRKRKYEEVAAEVKALGGSTRRKVDGVQRRLGITELEEVLVSLRV